MPTLDFQANENFCVPAALAALTTGKFNDAQALLRKHFGEGQSYNKGLFYPIILKVLREEGYLVEQMTGGFRPLGTYLLCFPGHVAVVENGTFIDNQHPEGIRITNHSRMPRIESVYRVTRPEERKL
jgi:hypothetical protein